MNEDELKPGVDQPTTEPVEQAPELDVDTPQQEEQVHETEEQAIEAVEEEFLQIKQQIHSSSDSDSASIAEAATKLIELSQRMKKSQLDEE